MNGKPIGGSPFPVFFSPPEVVAPPEAQAADIGAGALTSTGLPNSLAETAQQIALRLQPDLAKLTTASIKAANMLPAASSMVRGCLDTCRREFLGARLPSEHVQACFVRCGLGRCRVRELTAL